VTLIIALSNQDYCMHLSDRRISRNGKALSDETNKATILYCASGRFVVGFTGLAFYGSFKTQEWLLNSLTEVAPPDYHIFGIVEKLKAKSTHDFATKRELRGLPKYAKRLSILFTGFAHFVQPTFTSVLLTNYDDCRTNIEHPEAWDEFQTFWLDNKTENPFVWCIGNHLGLNQTHLSALMELLKKRPPALALIHKGMEIIREAAAHRKSENSVGKQITSVILPADSRESHISRYHTNTVSTSIYVPSIINLTRERQIAIMSAEIQVGNDQGPVPIAFPRLGRNVPCACGSGKKYKHCHGRLELQ